MLGEIDVSLLFQTDNDLIDMRQNIHQVFFDIFQEGFRKFIHGEWKKARNILKQVEAIKRSYDGPTKLIVDFMEKHNFEAPADWQGFRREEEH